MWVYNLLDIAATMTEAMIFYVMTLCFCREFRFPKWISRMLPLVVHFLATIFLTYLTDLGANKIYVLMVLMVGLCLICYRVSLHYALIVVEVTWLFMVPLSESLILVIANLIFDGNVQTEVAGTSIIRWQIYLSIILFRMLILLPVGYRLLRNFRCEIQWKDTLILSLSFLLFFSAVFASTYGYLKLRMQDMILLDAAAVVFAVFFVVQFLYFRNVSYLREQERRDKEQIDRMQRQFVYYQQKQRDEERVRAIYHDMKNHLLVLERGARMMTKPALDKTSDHIYGGGVKRIPI